MPDPYHELDADPRLWATETQFYHACDELGRFSEQDFKQKSDESLSKMKWRALCFRRDLRALLECQPAHGSAQLGNLCFHVEFDSFLRKCLLFLEKKMASIAQGLPLNALFGAWEGGLRGQEFQAKDSCAFLPKVVASFNVMGGFGKTNSFETNFARISALAAELHAQGVVVASIQEPRLAPGAPWPEWCGFQFFGERSTDPCTVGALVLNELQGQVTQVQDLGSERALWLHWADHSNRPDSQAFETIVLCVYAPQPGYSVAVRRSFWRDRLLELGMLRKRKAFAQCKLIILGDFNAHFADLSEANARLESRFDRELKLSLRADFNCQVANPPGSMTHKSGTAIDIIAVPPDVEFSFSLIPPGFTPIHSDHGLLVCKFQHVVSVSTDSSIGFARWTSDSDWPHALSKLQKVLQFIIGWTWKAQLDEDILTLVSEGRQRNARLAILDRAVWYRAVLFVMAGHFADCVQVQPPKHSLTSRPREQWRKFLLQVLPPETLAEALTEDEVRLKLEGRGFTGFDKKTSRCLQQFFLLSSSGFQPQAEALLSSLIKPKKPVSTAFVDEETGLRLNPVQTLDLLTEEVLNRADICRGPSSSFHILVEKEVKEARRTAQRFTRSERETTFSLIEVRMVLRQMQLTKRTLHFPRQAVRPSEDILLLVTWSIVNLAASLGLVSSLWWREIAPIRKSGPMVVTNPSLLRPIGYTDELAGVFDALWLMKVRDRLDSFSGPSQAGGKFDATLITLGILVVLQLRTNLGLPTFLEKVDLLQGFDISWRDGIRRNLAQAGVDGRLWLLADSALEQDKFRIRLGPLVGELAGRNDFGVAQGSRSSVHTFSCLVKSLSDTLSDHVIGVGLDVPRPACRAYSEAVPHLWPLDQRFWAPILRQCESCEPLLATESEFLIALSPLSDDQRLVTLDLWAQSSVLVFQFVDDVFIPQSSISGVRGVNHALQEFSDKFRHRFKGGSKRAAVLPVGTMKPNEETLGTLHQEPVVAVDKLHVLGPTIDAGLTLQLQLDVVCARCMALTAELSASLSSLGVGLPLLIAQFESRVMPSILYGAEVLASCDLGWSLVTKRLNEAQYNAFKLLLGAGQDLSLGSGGQAKLFWLLGLTRRLGTELGKRVCTSKARLLLLGPDSCVNTVVTAASNVTGGTWLDHSDTVARELGIRPSFEEFLSQLPVTPSSREENKRCVQTWKKLAVLKAVENVELQWMRNQFLKFEITDTWHETEVNFLLSPKQMMCAPWPRTMWKFHKAWIVCKLTAAFPLKVWGLPSNLRVLERCPCCHHQPCSLHHLFLECPEMTRFRSDLQCDLNLQQIFAVDQCLSKWASQIKFVGLTISLLVDTLRQ